MDTYGCYNVPKLQQSFYFAENVIFEDLLFCHFSVIKYVHYACWQVIMNGSCRSQQWKAFLRQYYSALLCRKIISFLQHRLGHMLLY
jgi:hypothetical protein